MDLFSSVNKKSVAVFLDQLALMIESGLAPATAVDSLAQQQDDPRFGKMLDRISNRIHTGTSMAAAFALYPDLFPPTTLVLVRSGEEGGDIGGRLRRAAQLLQRQLDFRARIKHAVTGPLITASACGLVLLLVVKLVFPKFVSLYEEMDLEFPVVSQAVFSAVGLVNHPLTLLLVAASFVLCVVFRRQLKQRLFNFLLWCPWTQPIMGKILCASLCETLAYLHKDGVPVQRALHMITNTTEFDVHRAKLQNSKKVLNMTGSLSEALQNMAYFPPVFHSMLVVGEESGSVDQLLAANQRLMEDEIDSLVGQITTMLEPLVICAMGLCMAILFVGMFLPIYGILAKLGA